MLYGYKLSKKVSNLFSYEFEFLLWNSLSPMRYTSSVVNGCNAQWIRVALNHDARSQNYCDVGYIILFQSVLVERSFPLACLLISHAVRRVKEPPVNFLRTFLGSHDAGLASEMFYHRNGSYHCLVLNSSL